MAWWDCLGYASTVAQFTFWTFLFGHGRSSSSFSLLLLLLSVMLSPVPIWFLFLNFLQPSSAAVILVLFVCISWFSSACLQSDDGGFGYDSNCRPTQRILFFKKWQSRLQKWPDYSDESSCNLLLPLREVLRSSSFSTREKICFVFHRVEKSRRSVMVMAIMW